MKYYNILHLTSFSLSQYFGNVKDNFIDPVESRFLLSYFHRTHQCEAQKHSILVEMKIIGITTTNYQRQ